MAKGNVLKAEPYGVVGMQSKFYGFAAVFGAQISWAGIMEHPADEVWAFVFDVWHKISI